MTLPISREQAMKLAKTDGKALRVLCAMKQLVVDTEKRPEQSRQTHAVHYSSLRAATNLNNADIKKAISELVKLKIWFDDKIEWHTYEKRDAFHYKWTWVFVED